MTDVRLRKPKFTGLGRIRRFIDRALASAQLIFAKRRVENFVIRKIKDRFEPLGARPSAQRSPDGRIWKAPRNSTILSRSNPNRRQALFNKGSLRDSIGRVSGALDIARGTTTRVATATVGIPRGATGSEGQRLELVGAFLQDGGFTPTGGVVPSRRFIGVSRRDGQEFENIIERLTRRIER